MEHSDALPSNKGIFLNLINQDREKRGKNREYASFIEDFSRNLKTGRLLLFAFFPPGSFQPFYPLLIFPMLSS
jgi:hypothetical protein